MRKSTQASPKRPAETLSREQILQGMTEIQIKSPTMASRVRSPATVLAQSREELIARYEYLADQYEAALDERDELKRQRKNLELEVASINKQQKRLEDLLATVKETKKQNHPQ